MNEIKEARGSEGSLKGRLEKINDRLEKIMKPDGTLRAVVGDGEIKGQISEEKVKFLDSGDIAHDLSGKDNKGKQIELSNIKDLHSTVNNSNLKILTLSASSDASSLHCHKKKIEMIYNVPFPLTILPLSSSFDCGDYGMLFPGNPLLLTYKYKGLGHLNLLQKCIIKKLRVWIYNMDKIKYNNLEFYDNIKVY
ncbi:MAG: hypothetical protein ACFFCW_34820, partial [Candidatus Hodarchaeota archaeon]